MLTVLINRPYLCVYKSKQFSVRQVFCFVFNVDGYVLANIRSALSKIQNSLLVKNNFTFHQLL